MWSLEREVWRTLEYGLVFGTAAVRESTFWLLSAGGMESDWDGLDRGAGVRQTQTAAVGGRVLNTGAISGQGMKTGVSGTTRLLLATGVGE